jgi:hypothetical protein
MNPNTLVHIAEAPDPATHPLTLRHLQDRDLNAVFAHASVADTSFPRAARTLLKAMGKDDSVTGMRMHASDSVHVAPLWLIAHRTRLVVVASAQMWQAKVLTDFLRLMSATPASVLLLVDHGHAKTVADACVGYAPTAIAWDAVAAHAPEAPCSESLPDPRPVPKTDWMTFRADCRAEMDAAAFEAIDARYRSAFQAARTAIAEHQDLDDATVADLLKGLIRNSRDVGEATAAFRATQAAFFEAGYNLRIDVDRLIAILAHSRQPNYSDRDWCALRAYRDPARPAVCALYGSHAPVKAIAEFSVATAKMILAEGHLDGRPLHPEARTFIAAQILRRQLEGAADGDPFIGLKAIGGVLTAAARDIGLLVAGQPNHDSEHTHKIWYAGRGYTYARLR